MFISFNFVLNSIYQSFDVQFSKCHQCWVWLFKFNYLLNRFYDFEKLHFLTSAIIKQRKQDYYEKWPLIGR